MTYPPIGGSPRPPDEGTGRDTAPPPPPPSSPPAAGPPMSPAQHPPSPAPQLTRRGRFVASIVFAFVLLLCASGGVTAFLLLRHAETAEGAPEPVAAVDGFLRAVYTDRDVTRAVALVCSEARDDVAIGRRVREVERYAATYASPRFEWSPPRIDGRTNDAARVSTVLTVTTGDEKLAEQQLTFQVVNKTGWWVCEVGG
jgi:hypothetical protein